MNSVVTGSSLVFARASGRGADVHLDSVTIALVLAIVLLGLVMVTSASVSIASDFTSLATTAKPRPYSPARAASIVALRASRLV